MAKTALDLVNELILELELVTAGANSVAVPPAPAKASNNKAEKKEKSKPAKEAPKPAAEKEDAGPEVLNVNALDLRVGLITKVWRHETAEKLYCEEIDVGEDEPRRVASGLVPHYSLEEMQNRRLIVVCNLKPRNLVGFKSSGMVLCAAKDDGTGHEKVEFVNPPANAKVGERIVGLGLTEEALSQKQCDKRKAFEAIAPDLRVDGAGIATWKDVPLIAIDCKENCIAPTVRDGPVR